MFRLIFNACLSAVSSQHRHAAGSILYSLRPWRGRGFWVVATVVTMTCTSPTGQLLGGYSVAPPPGTSGSVPLDFSDRPIPADLDMELGTAQDVGAVHEAQFWVEAGQSSLHQLAWHRAKEQFSRATSVDPSNGEAYLGLAEAHLRLQEPALALEDSQRALYFLGRDQRHLKMQWLAHLAHQRASAELSHRQGQRLARATLIDSVDEALRLYPADPALYVLRGQLETKGAERGSASSEAAIVWMRKALELAPEDPMAHFELVQRLEAQGRLQAAREHAARFLEEVQTPAAYVDLARLDWLQGDSRSALNLLRESLARHDRAESGTSTPWGRTPDVVKTLFPLISLEGELGFVEEAQRHAERLFGLDVEGRTAGLSCLPVLQLLQHQALAQAALDVARRCEEKASLLAKVLGAAYRGEAELALGRPAAAARALQDAESAHRRLVGDLGPDLEERPFALAAELTLAQLRGKLDLLAGERRAGEVRLQDLVNRLRELEGFDGWLIGRQRLQEIGRVADRMGQFQLAIASARALEKLAPSASADRRETTTGSQPAAELQVNDNWVVWTER